MTGITRRAALASTVAAVAVASVPGAVQAGKLPLDDAKTREALELFGQLNPERQGISLDAMRLFLEVQRANESRGFTTEDDARAARDLERQIGGMTSGWTKTARSTSVPGSVPRDSAWASRSRESSPRPSSTMVRSVSCRCTRTPQSS